MSEKPKYRKTISVIELDNFLESLQMSFDNHYNEVSSNTKLYDLNNARYVLIEQIRDKIKEVNKID